MENPVWKRQQLEDLWRERQQAALAQYRASQVTTRAAQAEHHTLLTPAPDGTFAISQALKRENASLREYCRVLTIFTDLVVYGKMPPEEPQG